MSIVEPLEATVGNDLQIVCIVTACPCAGDFNLRNKVPGTTTYTEISNGTLSTRTI